MIFGLWEFYVVVAVYMLVAVSMLFCHVGWEL